MNTTYSVIKAVTEETSLQVIMLMVSGKERYALIDQDNHVVGLETSDKPYTPFESINQAINASVRPLKQNSKYKGFPVTHVSNNTYVLDTAEDVTHRDIGFNDLVRRGESLAQSAADLYRKVHGREYQGGSILGEFSVVA
ncbi:hypothetical protein ABJY94_18710 [Vibrio parahaemolyticus]|uniref:hypothetical protein n=1 Tax=Vibrio parahaemolyticus TaxID=670 RepID=UPI0032B01296